MNNRKFKLGVVINPYAGIGGALALKGSDGAEIREQALAAGAVKKANEKTARALSTLLSVKEQLDIFTAASEMGEDILKHLGFSPTLVYTPETAQTESTDTRLAAKNLVQHGVDLILFAGGDGTARNVYDAVGNAVPVIGVPAGCKIHSGVYAITPSAAGEVALQMIQGMLVSEIIGEVRDIDEQAFRLGKVMAKHYGQMRVPHSLTYVQSVKMGGQESEELVLDDMIAEIQDEIDSHPDCFFIMGSGSTVAALMNSMGIENTLLGVDVIKDSTLFISDATAHDLEQLVVNNPDKVKAIITVIGGQGHIFGRGNQQLSPTVIKAIGKQSFHILASKSKLESLNGRSLIADTGDTNLDAELSGPISIISGYRDRVLYPVA